MNWKCVVALGALGLALFASSAEAVSIGLHFRNGVSGSSVTSSAGVVPQINWNNSDGDTSGDTSVDPSDIVGSTIVDSNGATVSGLDIAWDGALNTFSAGNSGNGDEDLMDGYLDNGLESVTFTGIPAAYQSAGYDVYIYFGSDGDARTGKYTDGTTTYSYSTFSAGGHSFPDDYTLTTDTASNYPSANYAIFHNLTAANFTISQTEQDGNNGMHGIQVVQNDEAPPVPEPSTLVLAALGLIGMGLVALRKKYGRA
jgi:hypothetical protein